MSTYYLYRHIRHDLNVPFYVGMGTIKNGKEYSKFDTTRYSRAFSPKNRNIIWRGIVSKTGYDVEIFYESADKGEIFKKEIEFIEIYGRRDKSTGSLANMTDGGDGSVNLNESVIKRVVAKNKANGSFKRNGVALAERNRINGNKYKGIERGEGYNLFVKTYVYNNSDGSFLNKFDSRRDAIKVLGIKTGLCNYVREHRPIRGYLFFNEYNGAVVSTVKVGKNKTVFKINSNTGEIIKEHKSLNEAASEAGIRNNRLSEYIKYKKKIYGVIYSYCSDVNIANFSSIRTQSCV